MGNTNSAWEKFPVDNRVVSENNAKTKISLPTSPFLIGLNLSFIPISIYLVPSLSPHPHPKQCTEMGNGGWSQSFASLLLLPQTFRLLQDGLQCFRHLLQHIALSVHCKQQPASAWSSPWAGCKEISAPLPAAPHPPPPPSLTFVSAGLFLSFIYIFFPHASVSHILWTVFVNFHK